MNGDGLAVACALSSAILWALALAWIGRLLIDMIEARYLRALACKQRHRAAMSRLGRLLE